ncbi:hypothetical protein PoB_000260700 [Plakobranchus ocellatus]|uniref:Uncharacterized protein n=1 Tax=Plakobranchus ocellatus TaxID=259542 RepID=A0AAV3Y1U1_9GAST|nr:hypothetical protein PoB_000260700 [Plakobranchus ocellatus]
MSVLSELCLHSMHFDTQRATMENSDNRKKQTIVSVLCIATKQGDFRLSGQVACGGARIRDRRVPTDLRADSPSTVPPTPLEAEEEIIVYKGKLR